MVGYTLDGSPVHHWATFRDKHSLPVFGLEWSRTTPPPTPLLTPALKKDVLSVWDLVFVPIRTTGLKPEINNTTHTHTQSHSHTHRSIFVVSLLWAKISWNSQSTGDPPRWSHPVLCCVVCSLSKPSKSQCVPGGEAVSPRNSFQ